MTRRKHVLALAAALTVLVATVASSASARIDTGQQSQATTITIWDFFVNSPKERAALMHSRQRVGEEDREQGGQSRRRGRLLDEVPAGGARRPRA